MPAIPKPGETVKDAVARQDREVKKRRKQQKATAKRNKKGAPSPPKPKVGGPLLSYGETPVFRTGNKKIDRKSEKRADRKDAQYRRNRAIEDYTSKPEKERRELVRRVEQRVGTKGERPNDQYVLDAHYRRAKQQNPRAGAEKVREANRRHDALVEVNRRLEALRKAEAAAKSGRSSGLKGIVEDVARAIVPGVGRDDVDADRIGQRLKALHGATQAPSGIAGLGIPGSSNRSEVASATGKAARALGGLAVEGSKSQPRAPVLVPNAKKKTMSAGLADAGSIGRIAGGVAALAGNTLQAFGEAPATVAGKTAAAVPGAIRDIPVGLYAAATSPKSAAKAVADDYSGRTGWAFDRDKQKRDAGAKENRERIKDEGGLAELADLAALASGGGTAVAKGLQAVTARSTPGTTGAKINQFITDERPKLQVAPNKTKPQAKSSGIVGIAAQRALDSRREKRTVRETGQARDRLRNSDPERQMEQDYGRGIRHWEPEEGAVLPLLSFTRNQGAKRQKGRIDSLGFRRNDRLANRLSRPAARDFRALSVPEQRAAGLALEGLLPVTGRLAVARQMVAERIENIVLDRAAFKAEDRAGYAARVTPFVGGYTDELMHLRALQKDLADDPGKVLTPKLRQFVENEQQRRPAFEQVAKDSVSPEVLLGRRFSPVGEHLGTRAAYEVERVAVERLARHAKKDDPVAAAREDIAREYVEAPERRQAQLEAEEEAVARLFDEFAEDADEFAENAGSGGDKFNAARARAMVVERFVEQTRKVADESGLGPLDPVYVLHRESDGSLAGSFGVGTGEQGAVSGPKRSDMVLFNRGIRDISASAYELGIQSAIKRSVQWRLVQETIETFVPEWAQNRGKGFTWSELRTAIQKQSKRGVVLDPQDWVVWTPKRHQTGWSEDVGAIDQGFPDRDLGELGDTHEVSSGSFGDMVDGARPEWAETGNRFYLIPKVTMGEMKSGGNMAVTAVVRRLGQFTGVQTAAILGSMPSYAARQTIQNMPMVALTVGGSMFDGVFYRNIVSYARARKLNREAYEDMLDMLGVRSKAADALQVQRMGSATDNIYRFEAALKNTHGAMLGGSVRDWWVAGRRTGGKKGKAGQAARTAGKVAFSPFRAMRDVNRAADTFQDRWARTIALAAVDAKMTRADAKEFGDHAAYSLNENQKKIGFLAGLLELPPTESAKMLRRKDVRDRVDDAADGVIEWLGDYANYTKLEQSIGRAAVPFYGFARHSLRLLAYTLPLKHPLMFAMLIQQANITADQKELMLREYAGKNSVAPDWMPGLILVARGDDLEMVDTKWINPLSGPAFEVLEAVTTGSNVVEGATSMFTPALTAAVESVSGTNLFSQQRLDTGDGRLASGEKLGRGDQVRVLANRVMGSLYPFRLLNDLAHGEKGKAADTSLPFDFQPVVRTSDTGKATQRKRIKRAKEIGKKERAVDMTVPLRGRSAQTLIDSARYEYEKQKQASAKKKGGGGKKKEQSLRNLFGGSGGGKGSLF